MDDINKKIEDYENRDRPVVRKLPNIHERVETGAIQFGDDWPGLFVRGDDSLNLAIALDTVLQYIDIDKQEVTEENAYVHIYAKWLESYRDIIRFDVIQTPLPSDEDPAGDDE